MRTRLVAPLFTLAIFLAATLLFLVQPMVGKMVLPRAGGSPQVWNTSLVFFQTALLAGYLYAHLTVRWMGVRRQAALHVVLLGLPLLVLPIALPDGAPPVTGGQSGWVLGTLAAAVGLPFVVLSAASPLLQRWLAATEHADAADPYFLYAGSNAGSLLGLLVFPLVLEPLMPISRQAELWALGYVAFVALAMACAAVAILGSRRMQEAPHGRRAAAPEPSPSGRGATTSTGRSARADAGGADEHPAAAMGVSTRERLSWIASAAVPSALLLGVTQYLTSQIAPTSLLWVLPLALYLLTFIVAFARRRLVSTERLSRLLAIVSVVAVLVMLARIVDPQWLVALLHLSLLTIACLLCHVRLADARPPASRLTEYYLLISTGGALGGSLSALVAPVLFDFIAEYPIAVALSCLFRVPFGSPRGKAAMSRWLFEGKTFDLVLPALLALYMVSVVGVARSIGEIPDGIMVLLVVVLPTIVVFTFSPRPVRFALGLSVLLAAAQSGQMYRGSVLHTDRTFFGVHRVTRDPGNTVTVLYHGSTVHGVQSVDPARAAEPLGYYHPTGPAGSLTRAFAEQPEKRSMAIVGAGTGALTVLAGAHQHVTLYEIDPEVVWLAEESGLFTYLENASATHETVIADGRIALQQTTRRFDLIVLDAFSSGMIPTHLLTREAFDLYLERLTSGGALLFHISNRHLALERVLGSHARDLGLAAWEWLDVRSDEDIERGIFGSHWVLLGPTQESLGYVPLAGWRPLPLPPETRAWTDDFSDLLSVQRWN